MWNRESGNIGFGSMGIKREIGRDDKGNICFLTKTKEEWKCETEIVRDRPFSESGASLGGNGTSKEVLRYGKKMWTGNRSIARNQKQPM